LDLSGYGNGNLSQAGDDFWNFGAFTISPQNQVQFLIELYDGKVPFSDRSIAILKKVMVSDTITAAVTRSKTGWARVGDRDIGWWIGYVERKGNVFFFATRISKERTAVNPNFGQCRKDITKAILRQLEMLP